MTDMTTDEWKKQLVDWRDSFELKVRQPIKSSEYIEQLFSGLPSDLVAIYKVTNGLVSEWFHMLPIYSPENAKNTWDSLERANEATSTRFLGGDEERMERFFIFAEIGGGNCACIQRKDGSIWFEDEEGIHQTDLNLRDFVETMLQEVADL